MTSRTVIVCYMILLFSSNVSAELFHHRDLRQVGYGYGYNDDNNRYNNVYNNRYDNRYGNNGYDSNRYGYDTAYENNGYDTGYGNNGYANNQYDQRPITTTTEQSYLKNGLKGAAIGALASGAYTWWKNGK
uniref:Uncharacterized protein n=1 Tax=Panagrolaimus sp. PS1159 TaxID=55785 RepID=A0AC35FGU9_9BILA